MLKAWLVLAISCALLARSTAVLGEAWTFYSEPQVWQDWCCQELGSDYGCWSADRYWSWTSCGDPNGGFLVIDARSTFDSTGCAADGLAMRQQFVTVNPWVVPATGYYQVRVRYAYRSESGDCTADPAAPGITGGLGIGNHDVALSGGFPDPGGWNADLYLAIASIWLEQGESVYPAIYADLGPDPTIVSMCVAGFFIEWDDAIATREASWSTVKAFY